MKSRKTPGALRHSKVSALKKRIVAVISAIIVVLGYSPLAYAVPSNASLLLGDPRVSTETSYAFTATLGDTSTTLRCYELDFGTAADATGNVGIADGDTDIAVSGNGFDSGATTATFENTANAQKIRATNGSSTAPQSGSRTLTWTGVSNGPTVNTTYYAKFTTYTDVTCATPNETITVTFMYTDGQNVSLSVDPSLTFTVSSVAASQAVNGATTTEASTSTTIPFGTVAPGANEIVAQDLTINTNASNGFSIYARDTGQPATGGGPTISDTSDAYGSPGAFDANEAYGFTTNDVAAFTSNTWAAMTTSNLLVGSSAVPLTGAEVVRVGYQVGVSANTEAGSYTTTVIYTAVPLF